MLQHCRRIVELMLQDHPQVNAKRFGVGESRQKYGLRGAVDGEGGYLWGGANVNAMFKQRDKNGDGKLDRRVLLSEAEATKR